MKTIIFLIGLVVGVSGCKEAASPAINFDRMVENTVLTRQDSGHGSGFVVYGRQDLIVTCQHVAVTLKEDQCPSVVDYRGIHHDIADIVISTENDIAIVRLVDLIPVSGVSVGTTRVGERVWACGTPFDEELLNSLTSGIMSGVRFNSPDPITYQFDVVINGGNSGGPIFNSTGEVVAIAEAVMGPVFCGVSMGVPSEIIYEFIQNYIDNHPSL